MNPSRVIALVALLVSLPVFAAESVLFDQIQGKPLPRISTTVQASRHVTPASERAISSLSAALGAGLRKHATPTASAIAADWRKAGGAVGARIAGESSVSYRTNGTPRQIRGNVLQASAFSTAGVAASAIDTARLFLRTNRDLLRLSDPDQELAVRSRSTDELGRTHVRFEQQYRNVNVWPAELIVHLDQSGNVDLVEGAYVPTPRRVSLAPSISSSDAITRAQTSCASGATASIPELIIYARVDRRPRLAWKLLVHESLVEEWIVIVDAASGVVLERFNSVETVAVRGSGRDLKGTTRQLNIWQEGSSFYLLDSSKAMFDPTSQAPSPQKTRGGIFIIDAGNQPASSNPKVLPSNLSVVSSSSASTWPVADTVSAAYLLSETYDYYLERHGRNSIDGQKGTLTAIVRLGQQFPNAFWTDGQKLMIFGDADTYAGSLDVIAHEMTHGVTAATAALVYKDQSGALNEAISDIFGEMTEARTFGNNDWLLGTQTRVPARSMIDPHRFQDPAKMSEFVTTTEDSGGVHTNSGIINHAYYMLVEGLPGAIGRRDAERIFYRALTQHLTKDAQFIDARLTAITSAEELFGAGSNQAKKTAEAFDSVEIFGAAPTPKDPAIPTVNGPDATLFVYRDPATGSFFLARKEAAADGAVGATLSHFSVLASRPAISADGSLAVFVDSIRDVCLIPTNGSAEETCLDLPKQGIKVSAVGMSADASLFGFVLFGADGDPEDRIIVVDSTTSAAATYTLSAPVFDGTSLSAVKYADTMTFTADGQYLIYDALNEIFANGSSWQAWSIYAVALESGEVYNVLPPIQGLDIGFPALGHTRDDLMTFEAYDPASGQIDVATMNLTDSTVKTVALGQGVNSSPSYTGDDSAIVFAKGAANATGASLLRQGLAADHISPAGSPSPWIEGAAYGSVYRRGTYSGPMTQPGSFAFASQTFAAVEGSVVTISVLRVGGVKGAVSVSYSTVNGSAQAGVDFQPVTGTLTWADGDSSSRSFRIPILADSASEGTETATLVLSNASGGSLGNPANAQLSITNTAAPVTPKPAKRRSVHH